MCRFTIDDFEVCEEVVARRQAMEQRLEYGHDTAALEQQIDRHLRVAADEAALREEAPIIQGHPR
jgi:hypothetical protein